MIKIKNVTHYYKNYKALDNINLNINKGLVGLIGENGAGKTTFMSILATLIRHSEGEIEIMNTPLNKDKGNLKYIRKNVGYMPQEFDFYRFYTVYDVLLYLGALNNIDKSIVEERADQLLIDLNLIDKKNKLIRTLSGGMKRRLGLACALIKNPSILIVDEPTVGLDPKERISMRNYIKKYSREKLVIMSTHIVEDIEKICDDIIILSKGRIVFEGSKEQLLKENLYTYEISCDESKLSNYEKIGNVTNLEYCECGIKFRVTLDSQINEQSVENSLEDIYMFLVGEKNESI